MPRAKKKEIPTGLHPLAEWRIVHDFSHGELATLLHMEVKDLRLIESGNYKLTDKQKKQIRIATNIIL